MFFVFLQLQSAATAKDVANEFALLRKEVDELKALIAETYNLSPEELSNACFPQKYYKKNGVEEENIRDHQIVKEADNARKYPGDDLPPKKQEEENIRDHQIIKEADNARKFPGDSIALPQVMSAPTFEKTNYGGLISLEGLGQPGEGEHDDEKESEQDKESQQPESNARKFPGDSIALPQVMSAPTLDKEEKLVVNERKIPFQGEKEFRPKIVKNR